VKSSPENFRDPLASSHKRARKKRRQVVSSRGIKGLRHGSRPFPNGHRLPSEQGFVNRKIDSSPQDGIGRHPIPFGHHQDVTRHHFSPWNAVLLPIPYHERTRAREVPESFEGVLGPTFLDDGDPHDHENKPKEHQGILGFSHQQIECTRRDEHEEHGFSNNLPGDCKQSTPFLGR
jgi:hypothetical protein